MIDLLRMVMISVTEIRTQSGVGERASNDTAHASIRRAAAALFASQGLSGTSMRQIARASGLHVSSLYYYFATKDQLYRAVMGDALDAVGEAASRSLKTRGGAKAQLKQFVGAIVDLFSSGSVEMALINQSLHASDSAYALEIGKAVIADRREARQQITKLIETTSADILTSIPADRLGDLIFAMIYGIVTLREMHEAVTSKERLTSAAITAEVMAMLDAMLGLSLPKK